MLIVTSGCDVLFRLLDVGVRKQERRGAPTSALRPGAALTSSKRHDTESEYTCRHMHSTKPTQREAQCDCTFWLLYEPNLIIVTQKPLVLFDKC